MPLIALLIYFGFQETHPSPIRFYAFSGYIAVADLREGPGGPRPAPPRPAPPRPAPPRPALPFPILGKKKKESQKEEKPAGQATKNRVPP